MNAEDRLIQQRDDRSWYLPKPERHDNAIDLGEIGAEVLLNSGLLWAINHFVLHNRGLGLWVTVDIATGDWKMGLQAAPGGVGFHGDAFETFSFPAATNVKCMELFVDFMRQIDAALKADEQAGSDA